MSQILSTGGKLLKKCHQSEYINFMNFAQQAFWFAGSFGLVPDCIQKHKAVSGSQLGSP